ncbi:hypothetical protein P8452_29606 [Trifolium repens]|nr:hypothetical protein P8452_29606 [Trifolium repens]
MSGEKKTVKEMVKKYKEVIAVKTREKEKEKQLEELKKKNKKKEVSTSIFSSTTTYSSTSTLIERCEKRMKVDLPIDHGKKFKQITEEGIELKNKLKDGEVSSETYEADMKIVVEKFESLFDEKK